MLLSKRSLERRSVILGAAALVAGCGFRPLYSTGGDGTGAGALFGAVTLDTEDGELGFRMRDALVRALLPARDGAPLRLSVRSTVGRRGLAVEEDDEITRLNVTVRTSFNLHRHAAPPETPPLISDAFVTIAALNATPSQYATLVSQREILDRAAKDAADKIVKKLAAAYEPSWLS